MSIRHFLLARILMNTADDGAGGGGGAGGGPVTGFTDAQVSGIKSIVAGIVNGALTAHAKQADRKRADDLKTATDGFKTHLDGVLAELKGSLGGGDAGDGKGGAGGGDGKGGSKKDVELQTLRTKLADVERKQLESEQRATDANNRIRATNLRASVAEELQKAGIDGARLKGAFAMLSQDKRLRYASDDADDIVFVDDTGSEVDYVTGLSQWLKSDEAKLFLPGPAAGGSGSKPGPRQPQGGPTVPTSKEGQMRVLGDALRTALDDIR